MTQDEQVYLMIKGAMADLPEPERAEAEACYKIIKQLIVDRPACTMAIALIGAELAKDALA